MATAGMTLSLLLPDGQPAAGATVSVPATGVLLRLRVPSVAPARLEIVSARIVLKALAGTTSLTDMSPELHILTELGPAGPDGLLSLTPRATRWIIAEWGGPRVLTALQLGTDSDPQFIPEFIQGRLKISDGGAWRASPPVELFKLNKKQPLANVVASRVMLDIVRIERPNNASFAPLLALTLWFAEQPGDLSLALDDRAPFFQRDGVLFPGERVTLREGLAELLSRALPQDGAAGEVELTLRAGIPGTILVEVAEITAARVHTSLDPPTGNHLPLPWDGPARGALAIGKGARITELRGRLTPRLSAEHLGFAIEPPQETPRYAQLLDPRRGLAQPFPALDVPTIAADIHARPRSRTVTGTLALHPDVDGRPGPGPFRGAEIALSLSTPPGCEARWIQAALPRPLRLPDAPCWIVLRVSDGELLCTLTRLSDAGAAPGPALFRQDDDTWISRELPAASAAALVCRVRTQAAPPTIELAARVLRGRVSAALTPDPEGGVVASAEALAALNADDADRIELEVSPPAGEAFTGEVLVEDLFIRCLGAPC